MATTTSNFQRGLSLITITAILAGCANSSKDVGSTYISPLTYQSYDCQQIAAEAIRLQQRATPLAARLDEAATNDKTLTGVGVVLFFPLLFALGGTKQQEAEFARIKGEQDALAQAAIAQKCSGVLATPGTSEAVKEGKKAAAAKKEESKKAPASPVASAKGKAPQP